ncbi:hypothetical protein BDW42DRAFT_1114 [Aspergillus taichungensis]|uniref:Uncharacterized protein n=1 Tax=Aspergillus taichungensis TaxID=482145 RepID=A0A2J5IA09_9EURO|nr:hypothetical protein BDW42DRAFT_1114 [Aspergillus taichungensis]
MSVKVESRPDVCSSFRRHIRIRIRIHIFSFLVFSIVPTAYGFRSSFQKKQKIYVLRLLKSNHVY